jgi:hypothetical protein
MLTVPSIRPKWAVRSRILVRGTGAGAHRPIHLVVSNGTLSTTRTLLMVLAVLKTSKVVRENSFLPLRAAINKHHDGHFHKHEWYAKE